MKKFAVVFFSSLWIFNNLLGQPILNNIEKMNEGDKVDYYSKSGIGLGFIPGDNGPNVTWDFSNINEITDSISFYIQKVSDTYYKDSFPGSTIIKKTGGGMYEFYKTNNESNEFMGAIDSVNNMVRYYDKPLFTMHRPLTYHDRFTDSGKYYYPEVVGAYYSTTYVDAWGTLILPEKTYFNVLRLKTNSIYYDTVIFSGQVYAHYMDDYNFYCKENPYALLTLNSVKIVTPFNEFTFSSVMYIDEPSAAISEYIKGKNIITPFINNGIICIKGDFKSGEMFNTQISDITGRCILNDQTYSNHGIIKIDAPAQLNEGQIYLISLSSDNECFSGKLLFNR